MRTGMQIAACGRDGGVAERGLDKVDGSAAVQGVGGVGVPEPVRRHSQLNAGASGGLADNLQNGQRPEAATVLLLAGAEDRILRAGLSGAEARE